jgi:hypothetical protein
VAGSGAALKMKDKTLGIALWTLVTLLAIGIVTSFAVSLFGDTQDGIVKRIKQVEDY